jgi:hypothetical protein
MRSWIETSGCGLRGFRETIFIFRLQGAEDEFGQQAQIADVAFIKREGPFRKRFEYADHATAAAERDGNHGTSAEFAASLDVDLGIGLGVVADYDLRGAEAGSGESGIAIDACADVGADRACRRAQDNLVVFGEGDCEAVGAGDGDRPFGDELQHFVENELFMLLKFGDMSDRIETVVTRGQSFSAANLIVQ